MIIDAHSHWLPEEIIHNAHFFHKGWADIEAHLAIMRAHGVDKAVLSYPTSDAHVKLGSLSDVCRVYNQNVAAILKRYPGQFIGAAILPVDQPDAMVEEGRRVLDDYGFEAFSLASSYNGAYPDNDSYFPFYALAQQRRVPIFIHAQIVNPIGFDRVHDPLLTPVIEYMFDITMCVGRLMMADIFRKYPDLIFIFANFGGATPFLQHRFDATYRMLRGMNFVKDLGGLPTEQLRSIYVDTGGDVTTANFLLALELLSPDHIVWGSDWPAKQDIAGALNAIRALSIGQREKEGILGGNIGRILSREKEAA
jgi:6-methylsalicylate decarboxylase